jgi:peptide-methionine (R)-S-oxide reductase
VDELRVRVMSEGKTEAPFTGVYLEHRQRGFYRCGRCSARLFASQWKFHSGCGWPSFLEASSAVVVRTDPRVEDAREAVCAHCGGHLGHLFGQHHYCVNSVALKFEPEELEQVLTGDFLRTWLGFMPEQPDPARRDERGGTLLTYARRLEQAELLIRAGARVEEEEPEDGSTSVHRACEAGQLELLQLLFQAGGKRVLASPDFIGRAPLACAAAAGSIEIMAFLLEAGAQLETFCPRRQGVTALFEAVWNERLEAARWLCEQGADADLAIGLNASPRELAEERGFNL